MSSALIDSHCHLNYDYAPKSGDQIVSEAFAAGVSHLVTIGTDLESLALVQEISDRHANVFHTVGVHPHDASKLDVSGVEVLRRAARHPKCRAIGEIGLDYYYENSEKDAQASALDLQLELALELGLPVVIHSRDAEEPLFERLHAYAAQVPSSRAAGVIHCFSGTREFGEKCIADGFYLSFSGILTFKNAAPLREAARVFPLEKLLVETDSPYLAPIPYRGKKCEPSMVKLTAQKLAEIKGVSFDEVAARTSENSRRLFAIV